MTDLAEPAHHFLRAPKTNAERIAYELRRSIARGDLAPGAPLEIKALAQRLKLSPIPVREALKQLEIEGFITIEPYRGPSVARMTPEEIIDFSELRVAIDSFALRLAVPRMRAKDIEAARDILDELERARDAGDWATLIHDFYLALFASVDRPILLRFVHLAGVAGMRYMYLYVPLVAGRKFDRKPYELLVRACEAGDVEKAVKQLTQLRRRVQQGLFEVLKTHPDANGGVRVAGAATRGAKSAKSAKTATRAKTPAKGTRTGERSGGSASDRGRVAAARKIAEGRATPGRRGSRKSAKRR